jgi:hypothetical protein
VTRTLIGIIAHHTTLADPPLFNGVKIAEDAYALGISHSAPVIERLCEAAFLAGANPDENGSRRLVDDAITEARKFLAIAAATRRAKTPQAVECEASQSGPEGIAHA